MGASRWKAARGLIDRVVLTPAAQGRGYEIELVGEIAVTDASPFRTWA